MCEESPETALAKRVTALTRERPHLREEVVCRSRLIERFSTPSYRLAIVSAPAGFGKTTLVLDWLHGSDQSYAWVSFSPLDNDPHRFFRQLELSLQSVPGFTGDRLAEALRVKAPTPVLASRLVDDLTTIPGRLILVMDDYHHIELPELHSFVALLPDVLPPDVRLVMISRVDPPFPLSKLRLAGDLVEVRERDLRFTGDETRSFFEQTLGLDLRQVDVDALEARTEGWIAGLQMAAISLRHETDVGAFVRSFTGSNLYVVDYLLEEVIQRQSPEVERFLLRTSILTRFDTRLCRAVTGMEDAERLLAEVETANLFLVALDSERRWYRYHHLFSELLAARLRRLHPAEWDTLHERASAWCEREGDVDGALHYARQMSTTAQRILLLERYGYGMLDRSEVGAFTGWSAGIPDAEAAGYPRFLIVRGWVHLLTERIADIDSLLALAESAVAQPCVPYSEEDKKTFRGMISVLRAYALRLQGHCEASIALTHDVLAGSEALDVRNRGLLLFNLGRGQAYLGATDEARASFAQAYDCTLQSRTWYLVLGSTGYLVSLTMQREGLAASLERVQAALSFADERRLTDVPACGYLYYQLGNILLLQNELDGAEAAFAEARERGSSGRVHDVLRNALVGLVRLYGARGDWAAASEALRELSVVGHTANPLQLDTNYEIERARLALLADEVGPLDAWCLQQSELPSSPYTTVGETAALLFIQARIRRGDFEGAEPVVAWLDGEAERRGRGLARLETRLARSVLLADRDEDQSAALLDEVLRNASAQKFVLPFLQYGTPVKHLLERALDGGMSPVAAAYARHLLHHETPQPPGPRPQFRQPLAEPLTEREQEVLFQLSRKLSYQAIADQLFVTHDTVKTHVKHIYAKLGATNRAEALVRGHQAGLLLADASDSGTPSGEVPG